MNKMGSVPTVRGGHPLAIVGKSGQRHVKVRDHLRIHGDEKELRLKLLADPWLW